MGMSSDLAASHLLACLGGHDVQEHQFNHNTCCTQQVPQILQQVLLAYESVVIATLASMQKTQGHRLNINMRT